MTDGERDPAVDGTDRRTMATGAARSNAEIRDVQARLKEYDPAAGAKFLAVDTETVFVGDGDTWNRLASTGTEATFNEVQTRAFESVRPGIRPGPNGFARINRAYRSAGVSVEAGYTKPTFAWIFDGGALNTYEHRDVFDDVGIQPVLALSTDTIGDDGSMNWDQVRELQSTYGWAIANHGHEHERFDKLPTPAIEDEVTDAIEVFARESVHHHHYVYPWGKCGGDAGRAFISELYPYAWGSVDVEETDGIVDVASPFDMPRSLIENCPLDAVEAAVDRAIANETGLVVFGHNVVEGGIEDEGRFETSIERIEYVAEYVRERGGQWVDTLDEVVRYSHTPIAITSQGEPVRIDCVDVRSRTVAEIGVNAYATTPQAIEPGNTTVIAFDETRHDHRGEFDADANRVVTAEPGTFQVSARVRLDGLTVGSSYTLSIRVDGEVVARTDNVQAADMGSTTSVETTLDLNRGDAVDVVLTQSSGGTATTGTDLGSTALVVSKLG